MTGPTGVPLVAVFAGVGNDVVDGDDAFVALLGVDRPTFDAHRAAKQPVSPPEWAETDLAALRQARTTGGFTTPYHKEFWRADGARIPVLVVFAFTDVSRNRWLGYAIDLSFRDGSPPSTERGSLRTAHGFDFYEQLLGELLRERTRLHAMIDGADVGIWAVDREIRLVTANRRFHERMRDRWGVEAHPGEIPVASIGDEEVAKRWLGWYRLALDGDEVHDTLRDGDTIFDVRLSPIRDPSGSIAGAVVIASDISDREHARVRLEEQTALLRIASRLAAVTPWSIDVQGSTLHLSPELIDLLETPPEQTVTVEEGLDRIPARWREPVREALGRCISHGEPFDIEIAFPVTGGHRWTRLIAEAHRSTEGVIDRIMGAVVDVSDTKTQELQLQELADVVAQTNEAVLVRDFDGRITYWNPAAERLYGWTADEAIGQHVSDLVDGSDLDKFHDMTEILWTQGHFSGQISNVDRYGRVFPIDLRIALVRDETGKPIKIVSISSDASERIELERRVAAAQRLESVGQLTGGLAHDFNNLLTVIIGATETIASADGLDEDLTELAGMVLAAADRGASLTHRLLAFSGRQLLHPVPTEINAVITELTPLLQRSLGDAISLDLDLPSSCWWVTIDRGQLETAMINLASNARDAMPGGGRFTISVRHRPGSTRADRGDIPDPDMDTVADTVELSFADTGHGMSAEVRDRMFEPYFTTRDASLYAGLGLSAVYGFVAQSGGQIAVDSAPGAGSDVRISLPRAEAPTTDIGSIIGTDAVPGGTETLLIVEDEPMLRRHAVSVLRNLGYTVTAAADATFALSLLDAGEPFDLVFTDIVMPGEINGLQLARRIRERDPHVPVLLTTGYAPTSVRDDAIEGFQVLSKPYRRATLAHAIRDQLDAEGSRPAARS